MLRARPDSVTLMEGLNEISVLDGGSEDERAEVRDDDAPCSENGLRTLDSKGFDADFWWTA